MTAAIFLNENLNHPENRINVALFGLMAQDWFRTWFLQALDLDAGAVVYPPENESGVRPDLAVVDPRTDRTLAWIEVELGADPAQLAEYRSRLAEPVRSVWGRRSHGGDLSLEEIRARLRSARDVAPQVAVNVEHLARQIDQALAGGAGSRSSIRADVSDEMREHPLVRGLVERLGERIGSRPAGSSGAGSGPTRTGRRASRSGCGAAAARTARSR